MDLKLLDQGAALQALAPFQASIRATSPESPTDVCRLIVQATEAVDTFIFGDLLDEPNVISLLQSRDSGSDAYYRLLELFAWGTWKTWNENRSLYPHLSPAQERKLRILSLLSVARSHENLKFGSLIAELGLNSEEELEEILRSAIADGLVIGRIDSSQSRLNAYSVAPLRDVSPAGLVHSQEVLKLWQNQIDSAIRDIENEIEHVNQVAQYRADRIQKSKKGVGLA